MKATFLLAIAGFAMTCWSQPVPPLKGKILKDWAYIPKSTFISDGIVGNDSVNFHDCQREIKQPDFYIFSSEISNEYYKKFLYASHNPDFYPDTNCWITDFKVAYNKPMVEHYFSNERYADYPVVGISQIQALEFCRWLENQMNKEFMKSKELREYSCHITLPTSEQWESVANNSYLRNVNGTISTSGKVRNRIMSSRGRYLVNYGQELTEEGYILKNFTADGGLYPVGQNHYKPDKSGIYNLFGNVAEWTVSPAFNTTDSSDFHIEYDKYRVHYFRKSDKGFDTLKSCHYFGKMENVRKIHERDGYVSVKGGSWKHGVFYLQSSVSLYMKPEEKHSYIGFRPVMVIKRKSGSGSVSRIDIHSVMD